MRYAVVSLGFERIWWEEVKASSWSTQQYKKEFMIMKGCI